MALTYKLIQWRHTDDLTCTIWDTFLKIQAYVHVYISPPFLQILPFDNVNMLSSKHVLI